MPLIFPLWAVLVFLLTLSATLVIALSQRFTVLSGKEMVLYQYSSPIVVFEGIALFAFFITRKERWRIKAFPKPLSWICSSSLIIYLLHMHPVFKQVYTKYGLLQWVNVNNAMEYLGQVIVTVVLILVGTTLIGQFIIQPISRKIERLFSSVFARYCKSKENEND